jgi:hypothetical protein
MSWIGVDKARSGPYKLVRKPLQQYVRYRERHLEEFSKPHVGMHLGKSRALIE